MLALAAACGGSGHPHTAPASAPRITGPLATRGDRIVDAAGRPVRLVGVAEPGLISGSGNDETKHPDGCGAGWLVPDPGEYEAVARAGFNSVRLGLSWANLEPAPPRVEPDGEVVHRWNRPYMAALDRVVAGFTRAGVAVVLDMHQNHMSPAFTQPVPDRCEGSGLPTWLYPETRIGADQAECDFFADRREPGVPVDLWAGYTAAWLKVVRRYVSNPLVVGADLFNEPSAGACPGLDVTPFYRALGKRIRRVNPRLLLICQAGTGPAGSRALREPVGLPGWVYSAHLYLRPHTPPKVGALLRPAAAWKVPAWIGELGVFQRGAPGPPPAEMDGEIRAAVIGLRRLCAGWAFHQYAGGTGSLTSRRTGAVLHPDWLAALRAGF
jgi:Cellulase (glycosyl hydrolase family 5)